MTGTDQNKLDTAAAAWLEAKKNEAAWRDTRVAVEEAIAKLVGVKDEGTTSICTGEHEVKTVGKINRTTTKTRALELRVKIDGPSYERLLNWKPSVVIKELKFLEESHQDDYQVVLKYITSKPAKTAVSVEVVVE